jgi:disulfide bond formation protein DsbB
LLTKTNTAWLISGSLLTILIGAWIFEYAGYAPCELCLMQRWAYYVGIPMAAFLGLANPRWITPGLIALGLILTANAVFGVFHAGVEWKFWDGPSTCSGGGALSDGLPNLMKPGVMCNEPALRILGLSLAGWNAIICGALAVLAFRATRKA